MAAEGTLPILQDTEAKRVWNAMGIAYRDVLILDRENRWVGVYNLTDHDLKQADNYAALKAQLLALSAPTEGSK